MGFLVCDGGGEGAGSRAGTRFFFWDSRQHQPCSFSASRTTSPPGQPLLPSAPQTATSRRRVPDGDEVLTFREGGPGGLAPGEGAARPTNGVDHHGGDRPEPLILPDTSRQWTSTFSCSSQDSPPLVPYRRPGPRPPSSPRRPRPPLAHRNPGLRHGGIEIKERAAPTWGYRGPWPPTAPPPPVHHHRPAPRLPCPLLCLPWPPCPAPQPQHTVLCGRRRRSPALCRPCASCFSRPQRETRRLGLPPPYTYMPAPDLMPFFRRIPFLSLRKITTEDTPPASTLPKNFYKQIWPVGGAFLGRLSISQAPLIFPLDVIFAGRGGGL